MLIVQKLICKDKKNHRNCSWVMLPNTYQDREFNRVVSRAKSMAKASGAGYKVLNEKGADLAVIKRGHDGKLWIRITARGAQLRTYLATH